MKPETNTVQQLFERDVRYEVPMYQRPYVWGKKDQWAPLWDDVVTVAEHPKGTEPLSHFLGAIVLDQVRTNPGEVPRYSVIDGQQRLTTLQILLAAAAQAMRDTGADDDAEWVQELVLNNSRKTKGIDQLKVWPTNADRTAFTAAINPQLSQGSDLRKNDRIAEAYDFFLDKVHSYLGQTPAAASAAANVEEGIELVDTPPADASIASPTIRAEQLRIALCDLLKMVSITLDADDNAQIIFETLNARGTPLLALDLVKNVLFQQATRQQAHTDALYSDVWQPQLDDDYWRADARQGRLFRPAGELFLMHWLTMTLREVIPATELFATFRQRVISSSMDAAALIKQMCDDAATMRSLDGLAGQYSFLARLPALDANVVLPVVLLLFRSKEISEDRRRRALQILESWMARRALTRLTSKDYNKQVPRLINAMAADLEHADDRLLSALISNEGQISRWPTDQEVSRFLTDNDAYGVVARSRLAMALAAVEASMYTTKTDIHTIPTDLTVEHLMPQDWEEHWPLDTTGLTPKQIEAAQDRRRSRIHRLGNLTLVSGGLNSAMQNASWAAKKPQLNKHSRLLLNARLEHHETFDETTIDTRGAELIESILKIWPGPHSPIWTH